MNKARISLNDGIVLNWLEEVGNGIVEVEVDTIEGIVPVDRSILMTGDGVYVYKNHTETDSV